MPTPTYEGEIHSIKLNGTTYDITLPTDANLTLAAFDSDVILWDDTPIENIFLPYSHIQSTIDVAEYLGYNESSKHLDLFLNSPASSAAALTFNVEGYEPTSSNCEYILPKKNCRLIRGNKLIVAGSDLNSGNDGLVIYYEDGTNEVKWGSQMIGTYENVIAFMFTMDDMLPFTNWYLNPSTDDKTNGYITPLLMVATPISDQYLRKLYVCQWSPANSKNRFCVPPAIVSEVESNPWKVQNMTFHLVGDTKIYILGSDY